MSNTKKINIKRTKFIGCRVNEKEYLYFNFVAKKSGMSASQLFRCLVRSCSSEVEKMLKEGELTNEDIEKYCND